MEENFNEGQYFFLRGEYSEALYYYKQLLLIKPEHANYNFKAGECYLNISGSEHLAVPYFELAVKSIVSKNDYNKRIISEKDAPLHAWFYLGNAYRIDGQISKALEAYNKFIDSPYFYGNYNLAIVENEIKSCERAKIIEDAPVDFEKINLGPLVNTSDAELNPVVSADGFSLVFTRRLKFYDAIFYSTKSDSGWSTPINISPQLISDGDYYPTGLSSLGDKLLLIRSIDGNKDIYISNLKDDKTWSPAVSVPKGINTFAQEIHASFLPKDAGIVFSSDRNGGLGGFDLYFVTITGDKWGKVQKAGKVINTEFDEHTPFYCPDYNVLFFSSKGHYSMGGYDIFYTSKEEKKWKVPVNIGYPINSTRDNYFYCPTKDCRGGFYALSDTVSPGNSDIYQIKINSTMVIP